MPEQPGSNDETIIKQPNQALLDQSAGQQDDSLLQSARRRVALVAETGPQMSGETRSLLRRRLRILAVVLCGGFATFLLWRVLMVPKGGFGETGSLTTLYAHISATVVTGLCAWKLCAKCDLCLKSLRIAELLILASSAVFFFIL
ncbi:MAG: hypothetical protein RID07_15375, partial [Lacipirellulaceae bacterium]